MKVFTAIAAAAITFAIPSQAFAQDTVPPAAEMQLAREIIDNGYPPETRMGMFDDVIIQLLAQMRASLPDVSDNPEMAVAFDRHVERVRATSMEVLAGHLDSLMESMVVAYAEQFTIEELQGLHSFIMTPEGHGFLARMSEVNGHPAFAKANQAYMQDYLAKMPGLVEQLRADVEKINGEKIGGE
ncbi:DUF2059 domain-containing protein [Aurantiacibacter rhizosphaerae]|uniref:DUF2059 domain-containing protein n=1 Tax=Aurantiacibacter rhizosphaerae TaxID=2691582 RepID=A0A844XEB5_9SPHN|nr:hypothetical protein [Aurantiacibacter rhizosphaerae]MWV28093.1 hypothetical protein [Aurantiacibacter rhizosphaerae]